MENSKAIRKQMRQFYKNRRDGLPDSLVQRLSSQISGHILQWGLYQKAETVCFYYPLGKEVSLLGAVNDALGQGKHTAFPKVDGGTMQFLEVTSLDEMEEGYFHVMEPVAGKAVDSGGPMLCFVPGIVFDRSGGRMGYGKGYYDRYFAKKGNCILAACAYGCQIADTVPMGAWDVRMDYIISEEGVFNIKNY